MSASTKQLIDKVDKQLDQLSALKQQVWCNFPGSTEDEKYAVLDIIAPVCDRVERFKAHLQRKLIDEL